MLRLLALGPWAERNLKLEVSLLVKLNRNKPYLDDPLDNIDESSIHDALLHRWTDVELVAELRRGIVDKLDLDNTKDRG